jgi:hypothetical protein
MLLLLLSMDIDYSCCCCCRACLDTSLPAAIYVAPQAASTARHLHRSHLSHFVRQASLAAFLLTTYIDSVFAYTSASAKKNSSEVAGKRPRHGSWQRPDDCSSAVCENAADASTAGYIT